MKTDAIYVGEERPRLVGKVVTTLTVTNGLDASKIRRGEPANPDHREIIRDVLVDTGATMLCLPTDLIERLDLEFIRQVGIETATGHSEARVFANVLLEIEDRGDVRRAGVARGEPRAARPCPAGDPRLRAGPAGAAPPEATDG